MQLLEYLSIAHVMYLTTSYHQRLIFSFRRGATEGVLDGHWRFEVETAAPQVEPPYIMFSRLKQNQRTLEKYNLLRERHIIQNILIRLRLGGTAARSLYLVGTYSNH